MTPRYRLVARDVYGRAVGTVGRPDGYRFRWRARLALVHALEIYEAPRPDGRRRLYTIHLEDLTEALPTP